MESDTAVRLDSADGPTVQRFDAGTLSNARRTPQGGFVVDASITRSGIFRYPDGVDYRPPEEVAKADSLATLASAPVTLLHPPASDNRGLINTDNFTKYVKGTAGTAKADTKDSEVEISTTLSLQDTKLISAVESGTRETSCGYVCRYDMTPGTAPDGTKYDRVQRDIRYNHIAVVPTGRAGESGGKTVIRLDSSGNQLPPTFEEETTTMLTIKIDGIDYPLSTPAECQAAARAQSAYTAKLDAAEAVRVTKASETQAKLDAAEARVVSLTKELTEAKDPAKLDAAISARTSLQAKAVEILGKDEAAKLDHGALRTAIIAKVFPTVKLDGKDAAYIDAMYDAAIATPRADASGNAAIADALGTKPAPVAEVKADAAPVKRPHEMPLAYSKDK